MVDNSTYRMVDFPSGSDWVDWWDSSCVYAGGTQANLSIPLDIFPVFHRKGSILPLHVFDSIAGRALEQENDLLNDFIQATVTLDWRALPRCSCPISLIQRSRV
jgi:alpha-glucosidase (family GH31 glycosyl hydrolase)